ncbi:MAG: histidinol-phosphatase [Desulfotomaculales bacterium]
MDYHIHPGYSVDAQDTSIFEYCREALAKGLAEICFTPHLEVDVVRRHLDWFVRVAGKIVSMDDGSWLDVYFRDVEKARREFSPLGLTVRAGLEVGFERGAEERIAKVLAAYPFDFVLGSIHCLDHCAISSHREYRDYFSRKDLPEVARDYFGALRDAVLSGLFDCIGHLDIYKRYGGEFFGPRINDLHKGYIEDIFHAMAKKGTGLEVNTSSRRRGLAEFHPSRDLLVLAKEAGIRVFTVGSDAHRKEELGEGTGEAAALLEEMGLSVSTFASRKIIPSGGNL